MNRINKMREGLTETEHAFFRAAKAKGFIVLRGGYPDFALRSQDGSFFVEVKSNGALPAYNQMGMMQFLANAGLPSYVSYDGEFPDLDKPFFRIKERTPRCDLCPINTKWEQLKESLHEHYRNKWNSIHKGTITRTKTRVRYLEEVLDKHKADKKRLSKACRELAISRDRFERALKEIKFDRY